MKQMEMSGLIVPENEYHSLIKRGETLSVEFKDDSRDFSDNHIVEAVVAMTNTVGGVIFVGVSDASEIKGCRRISDRTWKTTESIAGMIMAKTLPACATSVSVVEIAEKKIVAIAVPKAPTTTGTASGKFLKRQLDAKGRPQNVPMTVDDIVSGVTRIGVQDFSATVLSDASIEDLNLDLISQISKRRSAEITEPYRRELLQKPPRDVLRSFGLLGLGDGKPNIAALLLFGRTEVLKERLPNHDVQYQVFGSRGEVLRNVPFSGAIANMFPRLLDRRHFTHRREIASALLE